MKPPATAEAFSATYRQTYAEVLRFVRRRAHPLVADDIVSETFAIAWVRRDRLPAEPLPWLYNTARNVMLNASRSGGRQSAIAVRLAGFAEASDRQDDRGIADLERRIDLAAAFSTLSPADQEVLALDAWEDLDAKAASTALGCSRATYSMRLTRARRRLAALLTEVPDASARLASTLSSPPKSQAPLSHSRPVR
ncbi:sigma-70 family RNA polymerase sigma factor [Subtercola sp. Z020]|uniref:RNA polymerase sigma factor n=1 Tax=Subtercola sp. Z020 TaxID=2080582 RepID=UPI000CE92F6A|nr:sigma-70 family RNA polymerase sigma factor [Subtercola sp. Z020]PPF86180.1 sigma-70 family RNA polymerase sigma factor [Subtercola sp. Z020]